jgi:hypothetical protein
MCSGLVAAALLSIAGSSTASATTYPDAPSSDREERRRPGPFVVLPKNTTDPPGFTNVLAFFGTSRSPTERRGYERASTACASTRIERVRSTIERRRGTRCEEAVQLAFEATDEALENPDLTI